ncbi:MAG TPA: amidohydrolase family protein [Edaphobacter sp.]|nr:amidohydrolase family protein [Edaphobacter sp.]
MKQVILSLSISALVITGCNKQSASSTTATSSTTANATVTGPFSDQELAQFAALNPIDTHTHLYQSAPAFMAMLKRLNLHVIDILVTHTPDQKELDTEKSQAIQFVRFSEGHAILCTTFNPFPYAQPGFSRKVIAENNQDFDHGTIAVKIWKNIGEQVKNAKGDYVMPDDPVFEPIYQDIAAHNKTLIAHVADPNTIWEAPNQAAADYSYYTEHPEWYMYNRPKAPSKEAILVARDHVLEKNPKLRVVGAHLGSMEADFAQLSGHLDQYPNFAVDIAARMPYIVRQPRADIINFINKYQDRLIYATDNGLAVNANAAEVAQRLEKSYAFDWRFFATNDTLEYRGHTVQGLALPLPILQKLYHQNAVKWFPGVIPDSH